MLIWAISTIVVGFFLCQMVVFFAYDHISSFYPKQDYLIMGDRINKDKSYQEIENFNYHFLIPKFAKVRYLFTKEALIAIVMPVGIGFMLFFALASLIQLSVEHFSEDKLTVFSTYRYYTTGIFYIFLSIAVQWTSIDIHFINILNEVKWKGLSETLGKVNKSVEEFRKKNSP